MSTLLGAQDLKPFTHCCASLSVATGYVIKTDALESERSGVRIMVLLLITCILELSEPEFPLLQSRNDGTNFTRCLKKRIK